MNDGAGAEGRQHFLRVFSEEDERGVLGRLFKDFEQAVGRLLHEGGRSEDGEGALGLDWWPVVGHVDDLADLAELDEQLRRIWRDDEDIWMGLDEDAGLALVGLAKGFAGLDGFSHTSFKVGGVVDAEAVTALAAEIRKKAGLGRRLGGFEAVDGFGQHERKGILPCPLGAGEDERVGKAASGDALAETGDGLGVAEKVLEAHGLSLEHLRLAVYAHLRPPAVGRTKNSCAGKGLR